MVRGLLQPRGRMQHRIAWRAALLFVGIHLGAIAGVAMLGISWRGIALAAALYAVRMFAVTAGLHRYFAHRAYQTSRALQLVLAVVATTASQQGVLWWVSQHRVHHRRADGPGDPHAPGSGFWWSHAGWFLVHTYDATEWDQIPDLAKYPELRWLDRHFFLPVLALVGALWLGGGWPAVVWGYGVSTVVLWHATSSLTSISHWAGRQRYKSGDDSRNNVAVAMLTFGDGWHNNHHFYPRSARHGFYWWELDVTYYGLRALAALRLIWDVHTVPEYVRARYHIEPIAGGSPRSTEG
jgi:stearoyl-CoA desaturase (delta-9 desaturase)